MVDYAVQLAGIESNVEQLMADEENDVFDLYYRQADVDTAAHEKRRRETLLEPRVIETCEAVAAGDYDALTKRRAKILRDWVIELRATTDEIIDLKNEIQRVVLETKCDVAGDEVSRHQKTEILMKDGDRKRREAAYYSEKPLRAKLKESGRRLYQLRNDAARAQGLDNFPALALAGEDLTVEELLGIFDRYEEETRPAYEALLAETRERFGLEDVKPWDLMYATEQLCSADDAHFPRDQGVASLRKVMAAFGRNLDGLNVPIYEDADIPYGGLCFGVRIPDDVRILVNMKDGMTNYVVLYHEWGHALNNKFTSVEPYTLKAGNPGFFSEGLADTWGLLVARRAWLNQYTSMSDEEIRKVEDGANKSFAVRCRRFMATQVFEIQAYLDAGGDLTAKLEAANQRFLGMSLFDDARADEVYFPFMFPMYNKNYMLARVIQRALHKRMEKEFGEVLGRPEAFDFMVDRLYADGATISWKDRLKSLDATI